MRASSKSLFILFLFMSAALALTACAPSQPKRIAVPQAPTARQAPPPTGLSAQADAAYKAKDWSKSQALYGKLLDQKNLDQEERKRALDRYSASAIEAGNPHQAVVSLEDLAKLAPEVKSSFEWRRRYALALDAAGLPQSADDHLRETVRSRDLAWQVKSEAGRMLAKRQLARNNHVGYVVALEDLYAQAPDQPAKAFLEESSFLDLRPLTDTSLDQFLLMADPTRPPAFPQTIFLLEKSRRLYQKPATRQEAERLKEKVRGSGGLANTALLGKYMLAQEAAQTEPEATAPIVTVPPAEEYGAPTAQPARPGQAAVALILPMTGRFAAVSAEIARGAKAAQARLAQTGTTVQLEIVNSESPDWADKLAALPPEFTAVGGPIRSEFLPALSEKKLLRGRAFFTFLPTLGDLREGADAWRFFGSPDDQVRAIVDLAVRDMGLRKLGVLYPQDRFGQRMQEIFAREAEAQGASLVTREAYAPGDRAQWSKNVLHALSAKPEALFIPDSYAHAQVLVPHMFMLDARDVLILGPDLWTQTLSASEVKADDIDYEYLKHAAMPASWRPDDQSAEALVLNKLLEEQGGRKSDFWVALGYDFVRFASRLPLTPGFQPYDVNRLIPGAAKGLEWTMAPLSWDEQGVARQSMQLVTGVRGGLVPTGSAELKNRLQNPQAGQ